MVPTSKILFERSVAALISAVEIYNKPDFEYRDEAFSILLINAWELLIKAKWLSDNKNKLSSLYDHQKKKKKNGTLGKRKEIRRTKCGNPYTKPLEDIAKRLIEQKKLDPIVFKNIEIILEFRNSSIHFYNPKSPLPQCLQKIGSASVRNFIILAEKWFDYDFNTINLYLIPISISKIPSQNQILLNPKEKNLIDYINKQENEEKDTPNSTFFLSADLEINFVKSNTGNAANVRYTNDPRAPALRLTEKQISQKYPLRYKDVFDFCKKNYINFKRNAYFHEIMNSIKSNLKYAYKRCVYQEKPEGRGTYYYSHAIETILNKKYTIR